MNNSLKLDKNDWLILQELNANSRQSYRQIARKLGLAISTVAARIEKLEKNKVIKKFCFQSDYDKLGLELTAVINIRVTKGKSSEISKALAKTKGVCSVYDVTGASDAMAIVKVRTRNELDLLVKKILSIEFVERTDTQIALNVVDENLAWLP